MALSLSKNIAALSFDLKKSLQLVSLPLMLRWLVFACAYFLTAKFGFIFATSAEQVSVIWAPTGISLAALLLFGLRMWPGVAVGAFFANITTHVPLGAALGITLGNTAEAVIGAWLLSRLARLDFSLSRLRDVHSLVLLSAILSTAISATLGVASLCFYGVQPWQAFAPLWLQWWVGDASGALIVAPAFLVWQQNPSKTWPAGQQLEALLLLCLLALATFTVFVQPSLFNEPTLPFLYTPFPFLIWAALRFGQPLVTLVIPLVTGIAIWATMRGFGPFTGGGIRENLIPLQIFMGVVSVTGLFLGAATTERKKAEVSLKQADTAKGLLAAIVESSGDAILSKTLDGIVTSWNRGAEQLFGYKAEEIINRHISLIIPAARLSEEKDILLSLRKGNKTLSHETIRLHKSGKQLHVAHTVSPVRGSGGEIIGLSTIVRDITHIKAVEAEHEQLIAKLFLSHEEIQNFTTATSQDLKAQLNVIHNLASWLEEDLGNSVDKNSKENLALLHDRLRCMEKRLDDLLHHAKAPQREKMGA